MGLLAGRNDRTRAPRQPAWDRSEGSRCSLQFPFLISLTEPPFDDRSHDVHGQSACNLSRAARGNPLAAETVPKPIIGRTGDVFGARFSTASVTGQLGNSPYFAVPSGMPRAKLHHEMSNRLKAGQARDMHLKQFRKSESNRAGVHCRTESHPDIAEFRQNLTMLKSW